VLFWTCAFLNAIEDQDVFNVVFHSIFMKFTWLWKIQKTFLILSNNIIYGVLVFRSV